MLLLLSLWGTILQGYMYLFRESYVNELLISFLPYAIGINFLLILFSCYKIIYNYKKKNIFLTIIWLIIGIAWISYNRNYINEYTHTYTNIFTQASNKVTSSSEWLSFLYANIYYKNKDFSGLFSTIENYQPDIILLVEYAKIHDETLTPLLKQKYPYVSRYVWGKWYDGDVIYSKYPLEKIKHTVYPWSFSHVSIQHNNKNIDFALIHTSAPVSQYFFTMRSEQLSDLSNLMTEYYNTKKDQNIILLGDFNLTPRSHYYKSFDTSMKSLWLSNITTDIVNTQYDNKLLPYTRCHEQATYLCSHIDHLRSNTSMKLQKINIPWSDHYGFIGKI